MNDSSVRDEALAIMEQWETRPVHVRHVARLAIELFSQLAPLHGLGERERLLLEVAGYLHDIGHRTATAGEGHHVESARLIRGCDWKSLPTADVEIVAQVARYHRKTIPELSHAEFRALAEWDRRIVQILSAVLRLADSFDRTHTQTIRGVRVEWNANQILFHLELPGEALREITAARLKGDLAQKVFQRDLVFLTGGEEIVV